MKTLFFRLLSHADKAIALSEAIGAVREGRAANAEVYVVDPASFSQVTGSPFAYWVSENVRSLFRESSLIKDHCLVASGTGTLDDFRTSPGKSVGAHGGNWAGCQQRTEVHNGITRTSRKNPNARRFGAFYTASYP
jgi:hypothetical protein